MMNTRRSCLNLKKYKHSPLNAITCFSSALCLRIAVAVCICAVFLTAQTTGGITTKDPGAKEAMNRALKALGGADKIGGIKSLVLSGTETPGGKFEIRILLPDNFIQINRGKWMPYRGVSQGKLIPPITQMVAVGGKWVEPSPELAMRLESLSTGPTNNMKDEWSYFLLGTLMKAGPTQLTLSSGSSPGVFTLEKNDGASGEIEFNSETGYPSVVRYREIHTEPDAKPQGSAIDHSIRFRDHFSFNGIMFPKVITMTGREFRIEEVRINPEISLKDFETPDLPSGVMPPGKVVR